MRSESVKKILSETPAEVKEVVKKHGEELVRRHREIEATDLTDEEIRRAIWSAKIQKWNRERNADYWNKLEEQKPEEDGMRTVRKSKDRKQGNEKGQLQSVKND